MGTPRRQAGTNAEQHIATATDATDAMAEVKDQATRRPAGH